MKKSLALPAATVKPKRKIFYGWWITVASTLTNCMSGGFYFYGFSTFFMPLVNEFNWSRTAISGAFSFTRVEGGIIGPIGGFLVDRFGPRKMMMVGLAIMGGGFIVFSRVNSLTAFYLAFTLLIAVGATLGIHQAIVVAVTNWFIKKRGTAIGITSSGLGLGAGVLVPVLSWLIVRYDWRTAAVIIGVTIWIVGIPIALVMRHRPEPYGYLPDGEPKIEDAKPATIEAKKDTPAAKARKKADDDVSFTLRQALQTSAFWLVAMVFSLRLLVTGAVVVHQIPFLTSDLKMRPELAATMLATLALITIPGRIGFGRLADVMEKRYVMIICSALIALGVFIMAYAQTAWHVILFLLVYAPAYGGAAVLMQAIRGEYFGRRFIGRITGFMDLVQMSGVVAGPLLAGWVFDMTGSYRRAFLIFAVSASVAAVLMLIARRPKLPQSPHVMV